MPPVSVVIPNWNGRRFLATCLRSVRGQLDVDVEVILVDNGSGDGSVELARTEYRDLRVVAFPENRGFSAAVNAGIATGTAPYVFLLNNDTELHPRCIRALLDALEASPAVAAAGPKILDFTDRTLLAGIGDGYTFAGIPSSLGFLERDCGQFDAAMEIFSPSGCAALYRRSALDAVGVFDEDFFAYYEDVDLGFRLQMGGHRCVYVPEAVIYHIGSATTGGRANPFTTRQMAQNMVGLAVKNLHASVLLRVVPLWALVQVLVLVRIAVLHRGRAGEHLRAYARGLRGAVRLLPAMLARRRTNLARSRLTARQVSAMIRHSEKQILESLLRSRGPGWRWAPLVRLYLRAAVGGVA